MIVDSRNWVWTGTLWVRMSGTAGGAVIVSTSGSAAVAAADNMANPTASQMLDYNFVYDGATWDRWQGTSVAGAGNVAEQLAPGAEDNTNGIYAYQWKPLAVSTYCPTRFVDFAANATLNVKATAGNVFSLACHNINGAARFIQLHNTATVPGGGAVPLFSFLVPTGAQTLVGTDFFTASGVNFSTGIAFAFSTTEGTYTAGVATDQFTTVLYK